MPEPRSQRTLPRYLVFVAVVVLWFVLSSFVPLPVFPLDALLNHSAWQLPHLLQLPLLLGFVGLTIYQWWGPQQRKAVPRWVWGLLLCLVVLCCRWNTLAGYELDTDESQNVLAARTLLQDNRFWISVDLGTHGPLVSLWLTLLPRIGLAVDYAGARLIGAGMLVTATLSIFAILRRVALENLARVLTLPVMLTVLSLPAGGLTAYNGEHPIIFMGALSAACLVCALFPPVDVLSSDDEEEAGKVIGRGGTPRLLLIFLSGVFAGGTVWAKFQGVPLVAAFAVLSCCACWLPSSLLPTAILLRTSAERRRGFLLFLLGIATPTLLILVWATTGHFLDAMVRSYLIGNLAYTARVKADASATLHLMAWATKSFAQLSRYTLVAQGSYVAAWVLAAVFWITRRQQPVKPGSLLWRIVNVFAGTLFLVLTAWFSAVKAGNPFFHYLLLPLLPVLVLHLLLWAVLLNRNLYTPQQAQSSLYKISSLCFVLLGIVLPMLVWGLVGGRSGPKAALLAPWTMHTVRDQNIVTEIQSVTTPNERISIWGWQPGIYVNSQRLSASRDAIYLRESIKTTPMQPYFMGLYLDDLKRYDPVVFIDDSPSVPDANFNPAEAPQVGTMQWFYETSLPPAEQDKPRKEILFSHEQYPDLDRFVSERYRLLSRTDRGMRLYVRKDRYDEAKQKVVTGKP